MGATSVANTSEMSSGMTEPISNSEMTRMSEMARLTQRFRNNNGLTLYEDERGNDRTDQTGLEKVDWELKSKDDSHPKQSPPLETGDSPQSEVKPNADDLGVGEDSKLGFYDESREALIPRIDIRSEISSKHLYQGRLKCVFLHVLNIFHIN